MYGHDSGMWAIPSRDTIEYPVVSLPDPIRYIVMHTIGDNGSIRPLGAVWISDDGSNGGFIPARVGGWLAEEMRRSYESALARGWTNERIFEYWQDRATGDDDLIVDRPDRRDDLDDLRRMLNA
jgi:hypothetical protein